MQFSSHHLPNRQSRAAFMANELDHLQSQLAEARRIVAKGAPPTSNVQARFAYVEAQQRLLTLPPSIDVLKRAAARHGLETR